MQSASVVHLGGSARDRFIASKRTTPPVLKALAALALLWMLTAANRLLLLSDAEEPLSATRAPNLNNPVACRRVRHNARAASHLPRSLRGLFWVRKPRSMSANLLSFASASRLDKGSFSLRLAGARTSWLGTNRSLSSLLLLQLDPVHTFELDSPRRVEVATATPSARLLRSIPLADRLVALLAAYTIRRRGASGKSVVWTRHRRILGFEIGFAQAELVQIVDEGGRRVKPAYEEWLSVCEARYGEARGVLYATE